jgi:hypothetical protein
MQRPGGKVLAARIAAALVLLWIAWRIVAATAADNLAATDPQAALRWSPGHAAALTALADQLLLPAIGAAPDAAKSFDPNRVAALAARALAANPLEERALRQLSDVAEASADDSRADALMQLALERSKRDFQAQTWQFKQRLSAQDYAAALENIDAILRVWPQEQPVVLPVLTQFAIDPRSAPALKALLRSDPPWRRWFLTRFPAETTHPVEMTSFFADLTGGPHPLTADDVRPYLDRLVALGEYQLAFAARASFSDPDWSASLGNVNDGEFDRPIDGLPFGWEIQPARSVTAAIVDESASNRALRVDFRGASLFYHHVRQLLLLQPGTYALSGKVRALSLENPRGLEWMVQCAAGDKAVLGETERTAGTLPWREFSTRFTVPATPACAVQTLTLVLPARAPSEQRIAGTVWYDALKIEPVDD